MSDSAGHAQPLGFTSVDNRAVATKRAKLIPGHTYSWTMLGERFDFAPAYLGAAGGMISRPQHHALLLITHPGGARSFDYGDSWDGTDLIYTGRGKRGDQRYTGQNRDVGENARTLYVFEPAGVRALVYLGEATCVESWSEVALDLDGKSRTVLRFRLRFTDDATRAAATRVSVLTGNPQGRRRAAETRPFDPRRTPTVPAISVLARHTPEAIGRLREKAIRGHHQILVTLHSRLRAAGWTELGEMRTAIDLWARSPTGYRVLFEAKTIRVGTERARVRAALAQLVEYRFAYGDPGDRLCLISDAAVGAERVAVLESIGIAVAVCVGGELYAGSPTARRLLGDALS